jgi:hypothetical protein
VIDEIAQWFWEYWGCTESEAWLAADAFLTSDLGKHLSVNSLPEKS